MQRKLSDRSEFPDQMFTLARASGSFQGCVSGLDFATDGSSFLVYSAEGLVGIFDLDEGRLSRTHQCTKYGISCLRYVHSSDVVALAPALDNDFSWRLWDLPSNKWTSVFKGHDSNILSLDVHPSERMILANDVGGSLLLWDPRKEAHVEKLNKKVGCGASFDKSQENVFAVSSAGKSEAELYDVRFLHKPFAKFKAKDQKITALNFSSNGETLAVQSQSELCLIDSRSGILRAAVSTTNDRFQPSFHPNGKFLVSGGADFLVNIYSHELHLLQSISDHEGFACAAFSPVHDLLVSAATGIGLWVPTQLLPTVH